MRMARYIAGLVLLAVVSYNVLNGPYASGTLMDKARRSTKDTAILQQALFKTAAVPARAQGRRVTGLSHQTELAS